MNEQDFEGTLVLEKLASVGTLDAFAEAVDADAFDSAARLLELADVDAQTAAQVLKRLAEPEGEH